MLLKQMIRQNHPDLKSVLVLLSTANLKSIGYVECYDLRSFISFHLITYDTDNCEYITLNYSENHIHTETLNSHFSCNMSNVLLYCKFYEFVICCDSLTVSYSFFSKCKTHNSPWHQMSTGDLRMYILWIKGTNELGRWWEHMLVQASGTEF